MNSTSTPCRCTCSANCSGVACSSSRVAAPARIGKTTRPPSPKVKASGGVPANRSSAVGRSRWCEKVSALASTSRWKCRVALGRPVVPEVKAISATSSAAVGTAVNGPAVAAQRAVRSSGPGPPYGTTVSPGVAACSSSARKRWSQSASTGAATSCRAVSSAARSSGMVVTTTPPAFRTPSQQATSQGALGPRNRTLLPGTRPSCPVSSRATASA